MNRYIPACLQHHTQVASLSIEVPNFAFFWSQKDEMTKTSASELMAKHESNYEKISLDLILYGEAGHFSWLLRNTLKHSAKFVMFTLEGKSSDSHCGKL